MHQPGEPPRLARDSRRKPQENETGSHRPLLAAYPDPLVSFDASVETLAELQNEGKIRLVGLSNVTREHIERARRIVPVVSVQNRYSFADREWDYVVEYCDRLRDELC